MGARGKLGRGVTWRQKQVFEQTVTPVTLDVRTMQNDSGAPRKDTSRSQYKALNI